MTPEQQAVIDAAVALVEAWRAAWPPNQIRFPTTAERQRIRAAEDALTAAVERMQAVRG